MNGLALATKGILNFGNALASKGILLSSGVFIPIAVIIGSGDGGKSAREREEYNKLRQIVLKALVYGEQKEIRINKRKTMPKIKVNDIYLTEEDINNIVKIYMELKN